MNIETSTKDYESWLAGQTPIIRDDLALKHDAMRGGPFAFLRATFYRWAQLWPQVCPDLAGAAVVLAVGDLHVDNFGTWRDSEGRLVWGINDFDEAHPLSYANDLVRLAASVLLAVDEADLAVDADAACAAILAGYGKELTAGGDPFVLAERHRWLGRLALSELRDRDPEAFWKKLNKLPTCTAPVPDAVKALIEAALPDSGLPYRIVHRVAGLGSLGRQRFVALAEWCGGLIAREAKALAPSACQWASGGGGTAEIRYQDILSRAVRCQDPFTQVRGSWVRRRLAPDCSRIELSSLPKENDTCHLLQAMGQEVANVHLGSAAAIPAVLADLNSRPADWLEAAAKRMVAAVAQDWQDWKAAKGQ